MKSLPSENYIVRPFRTHKVQTYEYAYLSGGNPEQVSVDLAVATPTGSHSWSFDPSTDPQNPDGIYSRPLYSSVRNLFYSSASIWNAGSTLTKGWYPTGSEIYVVSLAQPTYGEGIVPSSFSLNNGLWTFVDDGDGRIVNSNVLNGVVGNIFYGLGIAVFQKASGAFNMDGLWLATGSNLNIQFSATHTIYEHTAICTMDIGEFNYSTNPSMRSTGSLMGEDVRVFDAFASGSLTPYMTTVGLYSDAGELVAVAKFPRPIKRAVDSQQSILIRFDI